MEEISISVSIYTLRPYSAILLLVKWQNESRMMRLFTQLIFVILMHSTFVHTHYDLKYDYLLPFYYSHFLKKKCDERNYDRKRIPMKPIVC